MLNDLIPDDNIEENRNIEVMMGVQDQNIVLWDKCGMFFRIERSI